jgi:hypothetical protein
MQGESNTDEVGDSMQGQDYGDESSVERHRATVNNWCHLTLCLMYNEHGTVLYIFFKTSFILKMWLIDAK